MGERRRHTPSTCCFLSLSLCLSAPLLLLIIYVSTGTCPGCSCFPPYFPLSMFLLSTAHHFVHIGVCIQSTSPKNTGASPVDSSLESRSTGEGKGRWEKERREEEAPQLASKADRKISRPQARAYRKQPCRWPFFISYMAALWPFLYLSACVHMEHETRTYNCGFWQLQRVDWTNAHYNCAARICVASAVCMRV